MARRGRAFQRGLPPALVRKWSGPKLTCRLPTAAFAPNWREGAAGIANESSLQSGGEGLTMGSCSPENQPRSALPLLGRLPSCTAPSKATPAAIFEKSRDARHFPGPRPSRNGCHGNGLAAGAPLRWTMKWPKRSGVRGRVWTTMASVIGSSRRVRPSYVTSCWRRPL